MYRLLWLSVCFHGYTPVTIATYYYHILVAIVIHDKEQAVRERSKLSDNPPGMVHDHTICNQGT